MELKDVLEEGGPEGMEQLIGGSGQVVQGSECYSGSGLHCVVNQKALKVSENDSKASSLCCRLHSERKISEGKRLETRKPIRSCL